MGFLDPEVGLGLPLVVAGGASEGLSAKGSPRLALLGLPEVGWVHWCLVPVPGFATLVAELLEQVSRLPLFGLLPG